MSQFRSDYRRCMNWVLDLLTQLGTTSNYSATANLHNSQITTLPAKLFPACSVFTSPSVATAANSFPGSGTIFTASLAELNWAKVNSLLQTVLPIKSQHGIHRKHRVSKIKSPVVCVFVSAGTCLQSRCSLYSYICLSRSHCIATAVHATV
jgi:hypothetical protein